jgi:hypothetical protein
MSTRARVLWRDEKGDGRCELRPDGSVRSFVVAGDADIGTHAAHARVLAETIKHLTAELDARQRDGDLDAEVSWWHTISGGRYLAVEQIVTGVCRRKG